MRHDCRFPHFSDILVPRLNGPCSGQSEAIDGIDFRGKLGFHIGYLSRLRVLALVFPYRRLSDGPDLGFSKHFTEHFAIRVAGCCADSSAGSDQHAVATHARREHTRGRTSAGDQFAR